MKNNLKGELAVMDSLGINPNYAAQYVRDPRTVKKYYEGYEGKTTSGTVTSFITNSNNRSMIEIS